MAANAGGFTVVADELAGLSTYYHDTADKVLTDVRSKLGDLHISGEQTGQCCREAGDALRNALQALGENVQQFSLHLQDTSSALNTTAKNYQSVDQHGSQTFKGGKH